MLKLTIFFDGSFWCGLVEYRNERQEFRVFRYVFGKEPNEEMLFEFIFQRLPRLIEKNDQIKLSRTDCIAENEAKRINPKRMQRLISQQKKQPAISTKAQLVLKEEQESKKLLRKQKHKEAKELQKKERFQQKQEKKHQKHRGH